MVHQPWSPNWYKDSYYIKFSGDTSINQMNYIKMWECDDEFGYDWYLKGYGRSDSNGDIYFRSTSGWEGLAYRFDVNVGDTFTIANPFHPDEFTVEVLEIDTVIVEPASSNRKRIKISTYDSTFWGGEEYWIEGIGSLAGIINSGFHVYLLTGAEFTALCYWKNNNLIYSNPAWNSCYYTWVGTPELAIKPAEIIIQPNPLVTKSHITLKGFHEDNYLLEITDMFGKRIKQYLIQQDEEISLHRGIFSSGLYMVTLFDGKKIIARKKLLIN